MNKKLTKTTGAIAMGVLAGLLAGCGSGGDGGTTVNGDVPVAYVKRSTKLSMNPTDGAPTADGGDLIIRQVSSGSAPEYNVTASITQGKGDASDPEASYDGKKIVFALRCPTTNTSRIEGVAACTGRWNIWEYDMTNGGYTSGKLRRITSSNQHDDADPAYLPAGGFVFSSNRQVKAYPNQALGESYYALDEYERERVMNLHTMKDDGSDIQQISFNQSHDRNPVVMANGDILFSRWEHVGDRNRFAMFTVKPNGSNMFVFYGAQSPGNSFLHPREMDPKGPNKGQLASSLMPLSRTQEGGALVFVDAAHYSEQNTPINNEVSRTGGQVQATPQRLNQERGFSEFGRITTPYPLWDGTNRVLLASRPCQATRNGTVIPCFQLTADEKARLSDRNRTAAAVAADSVKDDAPAAYGIFMFNPANGQTLLVASPPDGFMYTDPIPLLKRDAPQVAQGDALDSALASDNKGLIEVRSIYDTDGLGRMGEGMLAAADLPSGCTAGIPLVAPTDPEDTRAMVADLVRMKNPADPAYKCSPARFIRVSRAVAPPTGMTGLRNSIGETEFEQQQILGYAPIQPDGSFKLKIPADTPIGLAVIDTKGRAIQTHTNWIQVRPGEKRTCDGCHSPRRGAALNSGAIVNTMPAALVPALANQHLSGETMAATRTRLNPALLELMGDPVFADDWADTSNSGVTARDPIAIRYTGNTNPADNLTTAAPMAVPGNARTGVINYPEHIQPLWTEPRPAGTCISCHADTAKLDLTNTYSGTGRLTSYEELVIGDPQLDGNGMPVTRLEEGVPMVVRAPALVETSSSAANTAGGARKSRLTEIIFGEILKAGAAATTAHPNPPNTAPDHSTMLSKAEKRLLAEWMDLGGQYYNDPFNPGGGTRAYTGLSEASFVATVQPILRANCMSACHMAVGSDVTTPAGTQFHQNRFVLTGSAEGDFQVTMSLVNDACTPDNSYLLRAPSTNPHPTLGSAAVLPLASPNYTTIANWIRGACP